MTEARVFYSKTGKIKFISHLDMNRLMTRAIKKARIPVWYTEGFNPHPYMTFSMPLSLGQESLCESFDIRLVEDCDLDDVRDRLNAVMPVGLKIEGVYEPLFKTSEIDRAVYKITFYNAADNFFEKLDKFLKKESIQVEKTGKKGKVTIIDLAQKIENATLERNGETVVLRLTLPSGNSENINPSLLIGAFADTVLEMPCMDILREKLLCSGKEFR